MAPTIASQRAIFHCRIRTSPLWTTTQSEIDAANLSPIRDDPEWRKELKKRSRKNMANSDV
jgi:hypothetical protein